MIMPSTTVVRPNVAPSATHCASVSRVHPPEPFTLVIFGATGDLASRKLLPALYSLWQGDFLPREFAIVGVGRSDKNDDAFRTDVRNAIRTFRKDLPPPGERGDGFLRSVYYQRTDITAAQGMQGLARRLKELELKNGLPGNRLFYLATDPEFFAPVIEGLTATGALRREVERPWGRAVIEKPFGRDMPSAMDLDRRIGQSLRPDQVYRIDHYLGKDTVQNLLAFRFGNAIFEPLFNREYVDHIQITAAESIGMEGRRGAYYDRAGALRDVAQNHLLQLLTLVTMDPPATLKSGDLSDAKLKVLRSLVPLHGPDVARQVVRGQYSAGVIENQSVCGYRDEPGVARDSTTETYVALRVELESWRWAGVPILLRTGKRMVKRLTEIAVQFKLPPMRLFRTVECVGDFCDLTDARPTVLSFRIQPDEGISLSFSAKRPGMQLDLEPVRFEFDYSKSFSRALPEAYERLLLDALRGDATLFMRSDELEAAWEFITPILEAWQENPLRELPDYPPGTWGPVEADHLAESCSGGWRRP
jgi:glucose-6-phosphate 1-dehydrogenase